MMFMRASSDISPLRCEWRCSRFPEVRLCQMQGEWPWNLIPQVARSYLASHMPSRSYSREHYFVPGQWCFLTHEHIKNFSL
ncbi:hypothetical protein GUJ93_ZPchr0002g25442 [Zizania palustris]|uniref:Uncharacterized protein n=1 Tax=Zizania palustris TaxID=103762 RepID=A0A8J5VS00_ZIZPA|nr:hypothetical protein GUJ93_ZPchr0002g25442 [Zizania palustris]